MSRTYGTVTIQDQKFVIEAEPHVVLRIRRMWKATAKAGKATLSVNAETCRDLLWFMDRYPLDAGKFLDRIREGAEEHRACENLVAEILSGGYTPPDFELAIPPRDYQRTAAHLCLRTGRLLLADDVGLGKTVSAIAMLADKRTLPAVVVTLTHLPLQWRAEINRFAPDLEVYIPKTGEPPAGWPETTMFGSGPDVVVTSYSKISGWAPKLAGMARSVIFDEIQELRSGGGTAKYRGAEDIAAKASFRLGLSATPIYNYGGEIHNIIEVLAPGQLGTRAEFIAEWCTGGYGDKPALKDPKAFGSYVRETGLVLRRTREDVGRELPKVQRIPYAIAADLSVLRQMESSAAELARIILEQGHANDAKMRAAGELDMRMRQATGVAKAPFVAAFVRLLAETEDRIVLFGWHHEVYGLWREALKDLNPVFFTGGETTIQKEAAKAAFLDGKSRVLVMSLRAGAGLDGLQGSTRTVVFGELDWSPGVHEQCLGRVHRDGQQLEVMAYFLVSEHGSDPIVADVLGLKEAQIHGIRNPSGGVVERLQVDPDHIKKLALRCLRRTETEAVAS